MNNSNDVSTYTVNASETGTRLDVFLARQTGLSRSRIKNLITIEKTVTHNDNRSKPSYPVEEGDVIEVTMPPVEEPHFLPERIPLDIIFQDEHIIVVNKPAGMVIHPGKGNYTGTLASALLYHCSSISKVGETTRPGIVHRLDKDTSGLVIAALKPESFGALSEMIHDHEVNRIYRAFVWGHPEPPKGTIETSIGRHPRHGTLRAVIPSGKLAVTHYETEGSYKFISMLSVRLETGRTHQIRVHLAHRGHHVFGDPNYGGREERLKGFSPDIREQAKNLLKNLQRQALHAERLELRHPVTGQDLVFEAPLPDDLHNLLDALG